MDIESAQAILWGLYLFTVLPLVGCIFGGCYSDYGKNNQFENCMLRGILVHLGIFILSLIYRATVVVITA